MEKNITKVDDIERFKNEKNFEFSRISWKDYYGSFYLSNDCDSLLRIYDDYFLKNKPVLDNNVIVSGEIDGECLVLPKSLFVINSGIVDDRFDSQLNNNNSSNVVQLPSSNIVLGYIIDYSRNILNESSSELDLFKLERAFEPLSRDAKRLAEHNVALNINLSSFLLYDGENFRIIGDPFIYLSNMPLNAFETLEDYNESQLLAALSEKLFDYSGDRDILNSCNSNDLFNRIEKKHGRTIKRTNKK